jgi:hypothetical protein
MLANVAYEPDPNWKLFARDGHPIFPEGIFRKIARTREITRAHYTEDQIVKTSLWLSTHEPIQQGFVTEPISGSKRLIKYKKVIKRSGTIFHALATPEQARYIFRKVIDPKVQAIIDRLNEEEKQSAIA